MYYQIQNAYTRVHQLQNQLLNFTRKSFIEKENYLVENEDLKRKLEETELQVSFAYKENQRTTKKNYTRESSPMTKRTSKDSVTSPRKPKSSILQNLNSKLKMLEDEKLKLTNDLNKVPEAKQNDLHLQISILDSNTNLIKDKLKKYNSLT